MRPYFKHSSQIATLSYVEAEFSELKTREISYQCESTNLSLAILNIWMEN